MFLKMLGLALRGFSLAHGGLDFRVGSLMRLWRLPEVPLMDLLSPSALKCYLPQNCKISMKSNHYIFPNVTFLCDMVVVEAPHCFFSILLLNKVLP